MAIRKIAQLGNPVLRRRAEQVPPAELGSTKIQDLIDDMIDTMRDASGAGIAAPQVEESLRIAVIEVKDNPRYPTFPPIPLTILVNPVIEPLLVGPADPLRDDEAITLFEGCLSVTGVRGRVRRPRKVRVRALDRVGRAFEAVCVGVPAAVFQHELDHLDGVLFVDRADPRSLTFLAEYERFVPEELRVVDGIGPR